MNASSLRTLLASSLLAMAAGCASDAPASMDPEPVMPAPQSIAVTAPAMARLIRGQTVTIPVSVTRAGYDGDIAISVTDLPAGVSALPLTIAAGQTTGQLSIVCTSAVAIATYATMTVRAKADALDASAPLDVHLTDPSGALDATFAVGGKRWFGFHSASSEMANRVAMQPDGKIVVLGMDTTAKGFLLTRLLENGDVDTSFGTAGVVVIPDGNVSLAVGGVAVRPDGSILVGVRSGYAGIVYAFDASGALDTTWNGSGAVVLNLASVGVNFSLIDLALTADGHVLVAGYYLDFHVVRLDAQGNIDTSFDGDGRLTVDLGGTETLGSFAVRPDGRMVLAGSTSNAHSNYAIAQRMPDGSPDPSFSGDGNLVLDVGVNAGFQYMGLLGDGRLVVGAFVSGAQETLCMVKPTGELDLGFDGDGFAPIAQSAYAFTDTGDGFVVAGAALGAKQIAMSKLTLDGALDTSFGTMGTTKVDVTGDSTFLFGTAVDSQSRLVTVGWANSGAELSQFLVARFWQ